MINPSDLFQYHHKPADFIREYLNKIAKSDISGGVLLLVCAVISLIWANSSFSGSYTYLFTSQLSITIGEMEPISHSIVMWINDALMVIFFFVVGLEIKHEMQHGELATWKKASLPVMAALGGMVVPAAVYVLFNYNAATELGTNEVYMRGWGVPMATDIAFAVGIFALMGKRVPPTLRIFLLALAIVDDLGAIVVIAVFYTDNFSFSAFIVGIVGLLILGGFNRMGVRSMGPYLLIGLVIWIAFWASGVHPTIAGVLVAFTIPSTSRISMTEYMRDVKKMINGAKADEDGTSGSMKYLAFDEIKRGAFLAETPMRRSEHALVKWSTFFIMPVFALANAGVTVEGDFWHSIADTATLGIIFGLFAGKQLGVFGFAWIAAKFKMSALPKGINWSQFYGMSILSGIGFTMALFVANLAFDGSDALLAEAKIGVLVGSLLAAVYGLIVLSRVLPSEEEVERMKNAE